MIEQDTIRLLRECDAGVQMGMDSIREVMPHVRSEAMKTCLNDCQQEHRELDREILHTLQATDAVALDGLTEEEIETLMRLLTKIRDNLLGTEAAEKGGRT